MKNLLGTDSGLVSIGLSCTLDLRIGERPRKASSSSHQLKSSELFRMVAAFHAIPRNCGRRLLAPLVDEIALTEPKRTFVSVPRSADLHDGFEDISFSTFATAINRCAWWIEKELGKSETFETIGYLGPIDLRYPILLVAAIKTGYKVSNRSPSLFVF